MWRHSPANSAEAEKLRSKTNKITDHINLRILLRFSKIWKPRYSLSCLYYYSIWAVSRPFLYSFEI
eukprot:maker-scaffold_142-snap-gene-0.10-mRNA-1 protein AED:0.48 eAED:1.00 QI:0/0/0/1/0/0/3/0/65